MKLLLTLIAALVFGNSLGFSAEVPAFFRDRAKEAQTPSPVRSVRREASNYLERLEDSYRGAISSIYSGIKNIALENVAIDGVEALLTGKSPDFLLENEAMSESDRIFLKELFSRLHLVMADGRVAARIGNTFLDSETMTIDVGSAYTTYSCVLIFNHAREWKMGRWHLKGAHGLGQFKMDIRAPISERERILKDGRIDTDILTDLELLPLNPWDVPAEPYTFPVLQEIERVVGRTNTFPALKKLSAAGDAEAQFVLGLAYELGAFSAPDKQLARDYYKMSADQKFLWAVQRLGMSYFYGITNNRDYNAAERYLKEASEGGSAEALGMRGVASIYGYNGKQSVLDGLEFLDAAAEAGDPYSLTQLGYLIWNGNVPVDAWHLPKSTDAASENAEISVRDDIEKFYSSKGKSIPLAQVLFERAAKRRYPDAAAFLGVLIEKNLQDTLKWNTLAVRWCDEVIYPERDDLKNFAQKSIQKLEQLLDAGQVMAARDAANLEEEFTSAGRFANPFLPPRAAPLRLIDGQQ